MLHSKFLLKMSTQNEYDEKNQEYVTFEQEIIKILETLKAKSYELFIFVINNKKEKDTIFNLNLYKGPNKLSKDKIIFYDYNSDYLSREFIDEVNILVLNKGETLEGNFSDVKIQKSDHLLNLYKRCTGIILIHDLSEVSIYSNEHEFLRDAIT